jgi:hypothetical protein
MTIGHLIYFYLFASLVDFRLPASERALRLRVTCGKGRTHKGFSRK